MALLGISVLIRARRISVLRLDPVIVHHSFIAPVELLQLLTLFTALDRPSVRCSAATAPNSQTAFCNPSLRLSRLSE